MILSSILSFDAYAIQAVSTFHTNFLDPIMIGFTKIGDYGKVWIFGVIFMLFWQRFRNEGRVILAGLILNTILGEGILKHLFQRDRPFLALPDIVLKIPNPVTSSFPSGHTSIS